MDLGVEISAGGTAAGQLNASLPLEEDVAGLWNMGRLQPWARLPEYGCPERVLAAVVGSSDQPES